MFNRIAGSVATFSLVSTLWFAPPASACYADYEQMGVVEFRLIRNYVDSSPITDQLNFALGTTEFSSGSRTDAGFGMGFRTYFPIESRNQGKESEGKGFFNCRSIGVNFSFDYVPQITTDDFLDRDIGPARRKTRAYFANLQLEFAFLETDHFRLRGQVGIAAVLNSLVLQGISPVTGQWQDLDFDKTSLWNFLGNYGVAPELIFGSNRQLTIVPLSFTRFAGGFNQFAFSIGYSFDIPH